MLEGDEGVVKPEDGGGKKDKSDIEGGLMVLVTSKTDVSSHCYFLSCSICISFHGAR
jgi:hypothetical protein